MVEETEAGRMAFTFQPMLTMARCSSHIRDIELVLVRWLINIILTKNVLVTIWTQPMRTIPPTVLMVIPSCMVIQTGLLITDLRLLPCLFALSKWLGIIKISIGTHFGRVGSTTLPDKTSCTRQNLMPGAITLYKPHASRHKKGFQFITTTERAPDMSANTSWLPPWHNPLYKWDSARWWCGKGGSQSRICNPGSWPVCRSGGADRLCSPWRPCHRRQGWQRGRFIRSPQNFFGLKVQNPQNFALLRNVIIRSNKSVINFDYLMEKVFNVQNSVERNLLWISHF